MVMCIELLWGSNQERERSVSPDEQLLLGVLQEASVVWHDLMLRQVKVELQRHQHGELEGDQLAPVHPKPLLQFLWSKNTTAYLLYSRLQGRTLHQGIMKVADGGKDLTCARARCSRNF